uniref:Uncharacterized protein n=1 Tax=Anguilla anguilla TaxID=7936 RepID=A0A0E9VIL7_ANGAN
MAPRTSSPPRTAS